MKLPNHDKAEIAPEKITGYLLSATHRDGRHKAAFFSAFGFTLEQWQRLEATLRRHAADHDIAAEEDSPFGKRYVVEGIIAAPDGRTPRLRSVWFIETASRTPRFVTAYPLQRDEHD